MVSLTREGRSTVLALVVPCYNEEQVLPHTAEKLLEIIGSLAELGKSPGRVGCISWTTGASIGPG